MKFILPITLSLFLMLISFSSPIDKKYPIPPNGVQIEENFFIDQTEMDNISWSEYLYWTKSVFGKKIADANLPDTSVWFNTDTLLINQDTLLSNFFDYKMFYDQIYFKHPAFNNYPTVGITHEQVLNYSKWRSDRVYEMLLIQKGIIKPNQEQNKEMYFTIKRYLSGEYLDYQPDYSVPVPNFRLPTVAEWISISSKIGGTTLDTLQYPYGFDAKNKKTQKYLAKNIFLFNTKEVSDLNTAIHKSRTITSPVRSHYFWESNTYNLIGNVAEMTATKGIAKGGSWRHPILDCEITDNQYYNTPTNWLGFRNVCSWYYPEKNEKNLD